MRLILFMTLVFAASADDPVDLQDRGPEPTELDALRYQIYEQQMLQPFQVIDLECTQAWELANTVLAQYGYSFNDDLAIEWFSYEETYVPDSQVTYYTYSAWLTDVDAWNMDLLMARELEACGSQRTLSTPPVMFPVEPERALVDDRIEPYLAPSMVFEPQIEQDDFSLYQDDDSFQFDLQAQESPSVALGEIVIEETEPVTVERDLIAEPGELYEQVMGKAYEGQMAEVVVELPPAEGDLTTPDELATAEEMARYCLTSLGNLTTEYEEVLVQVAELEAETQELRVMAARLQADDAEDVLAYEEALGQIEALDNERARIVADRDALLIAHDELRGVYATLTLERDELAQDRDALVIERDRLAGDITLLETRNENLLDANIALTAQVDELDERLVFQVAALHHVSEIFDPLVPQEPTVVEVAIEADTQESTDVTEPAFSPYADAYNAAQSGKVIHEDVVGELTCQQVPDIYTLVFDRSGTGWGQEKALPKSADKLNALRLRIHAREMDCPVSLPVDS